MSLTVDAVTPAMERTGPGQERWVRRHEEILTRLALNDETFIESALHMQVLDMGSSGLDPKTHALVRLGALLAMEVATPSYEEIVSMARVAGATEDEIVGVLLSVASTIGVARVVSAAPKLGLAVGFDIDRALEGTDPVRSAGGPAAARGAGPHPARDRQPR